MNRRHSIAHRKPFGVGRDEPRLLALRFPQHALECEAAALSFLSAANAVRWIIVRRMPAVIS